MSDTRLLAEALDDLAAEIPVPDTDGVRARIRARHRRRLVISLATASIVLTVAGLVALTAPGRERERPVTVAAEAKAAALDRGDVVVFLEPTADSAVVEDIGARLADRADVTDLHYVDQAAALEEFREIFSDQRDLTERVTAESLPSSWRLRLRVRTPERAREIRDLAETWPGVREAHVAEDLE